MKHKWKVDKSEDFEKKENVLVDKYFKDKEPTTKGKLYITSGKFRGFAIDIPKNTRPVTSSLRKRIFDVLGSDVADKKVLDLYAGSGVLGFESLSRDAKSVVFVDVSKSAESVLINNIKKLSVSIETTLLRQKVEDFLDNTDDYFDIIFIDPPYKYYNRKDTVKIDDIINKAAALLTGVKTKTKTNFQGVLIMKHPKRYNVESTPVEYLKCIKRCCIGINCVSFFIINTNYHE